MTYKDLQIGQKIKIKEYIKERLEDRANYKKVTYTITEKYPHMCIVEDEKGYKRGLSMGDLIMNGIIRQRAELEAIRKDQTQEVLEREEYDETEKHETQRGHGAD